MRNTEEINKIKEEILKVTTRLKELTRDLRNLVIEEDNNTSNEIYTWEFTRTFSNTFKKGDTVRITNKYKEKGIIGEVTKSGRYFTNFKDKHSREYKRTHHNLERISKKSETTRTTLWMKLAHQIKKPTLTETPEEKMARKNDQTKEDTEDMVVVGVKAHEEIESKIV